MKDTADPIIHYSLYEQGRMIPFETVRLNGIDHHI